MLTQEPMNTTTAHVTALAARFSLIMNEWLSKTELAEVNRRNAAEASDLVCHSHDFCDANMAMDEAFQAIIGRNVDGDDEDDCRLWNAAWNAAREKGFAW